MAGEISITGKRFGSTWFFSSAFCSFFCIFIVLFIVVFFSPHYNRFNWFFIMGHTIYFTILPVISCGLFYNKRASVLFGVRQGHLVGMLEVLSLLCVEEKHNTYSLFCVLILEMIRRNSVEVLVVLRLAC